MLGRFSHRALVRHAAHAPSLCRRAVFAQAERFVYLRDDVCGEDNSWWIHNVRATALQPHAAKVGRMSALTAHSTLRSPQCAVMHATYALYAAARVLG